MRVKTGARCVLRFYIIPETLLLHDRVNIFWDGMAISRSLWALATNSTVPGTFLGVAGTWPLLGEILPRRSELVKTAGPSEVSFISAPSEIKLRREVPPSRTMAWSQTV